MKTPILPTILLLIGLFFNANLYAGCTGVCLHKDTIAAVSGASDTVVISPSSSTTIFASYNGACALMMASTNVTLIWFKDGIAFDTTNASNTFFDGVWEYTSPLTVSSSGVYTVYFMGFESPINQCGQVVVLNGTGESEPNRAVNSSFKDFTIFPNPSNDVITIKSNYSNDQFDLLNHLGEKLLQFNVSNGQSNFSIAHLDTGIYFLRQNQTNRIQKLVVAR